jgi:xylulokinase
MYVEKFIKKRKIKETPGMTKKDIVMPELNIIGGGGSSDTWCQIFADVLNRTIRQVKDPIQANARGAAFIAAVGLGYLTWDQIPDLIQISKVFTPNPENRVIYDKLFNEFTNIYKIMKKTHRRLNE